MLQRALGSRLLRPTGVWRAQQTRSKITIPAVGSSGSGARRRRLKPKLPQAKFVALSTEFLDRVQAAVDPLHPPTNESFRLERDGNSGLTIFTNATQFVLEVVPSKQQLNFTSPVSGLRVYEWNALSKRWEDETDSHDIEGLLTRDLMRFCAGVPLF